MKEWDLWESREIEFQADKASGKKAFETYKGLVGAWNNKSLIAGAQWPEGEWHEVRSGRELVQKWDPNFDPGMMGSH